MKIAGQTPIVFAPWDVTSPRRTPKSLSYSLRNVEVDQWSLDIRDNVTKNDRLHGFYGLQSNNRNEPTLLGNNVPAFGDIRKNFKQIFTVNLTSIFNNATVNEARGNVPPL